MYAVFAISPDFSRLHFTGAEIARMIVAAAALFGIFFLPLSIRTLSQALKLTGRARYTKAEITAVRQTGERLWTAELQPETELPNLPHPALELVEPVPEGTTVFIGVVPSKPPYVMPVQDIVLFRRLVREKRRRLRIALLVHTVSAACVILLLYITKR